MEQQPASYLEAQIALDELSAVCDEALIAFIREPSVELEQRLRDAQAGLRAARRLFVERQADYYQAVLERSTSTQEEC